MATRRGIAALVVVSGLVATGCGDGPATTAASPSAAPSATAPPSTTAPSTTAAPSETAALPISVQTDAEMVAAGNEGPSSSILAPTGCGRAGAVVTAGGAYTNGGLAPEVYDRYGDTVRLYVYSAPVAGYPQGVQLADLGAEPLAPIGGRGTWRIAAPLELSLGTPVACVVTAQPTHDVQLAPP